MSVSMTLCTALFAVPPLASSNKAAFYVIGDLPGAQFLSSAFAASSSRPLRVVGTGHAQHHNEELTEGVLWTIAEGLIELPHPPGSSSANGISADGERIVGKWNGWLDSNLVQVATVWSGDGWNYTLIGDLPAGNTVGAANAVSEDGSVIAGTGTTLIASFGMNEAFRWTQRSGFAGLGAIAPNVNGHSFSECTDVSDNGKILVGSSSSSPLREAMRWNEETGMQGLGLLPGAMDSRAFAVSGDGSVVVGMCYFQNSPTAAFRWDEATGIQPVAPAGTGQFGTRAKSISADGTLILGQRESNLPPRSAVMWEGAGPMRLVQEVLEKDYGIEIPKGWQLTDAYCSPEGGVLVGSVAHGTTVEGWVAVLFKPDTNGDGEVNVTDLLDVISTWGRCQNCESDINRDGNVNIEDLCLIINNWS